MPYTPPSPDPYIRAFEHVRKMPDGNRAPFLRGVIDSIGEHGTPESREEALKILLHMNDPKQGE